MVGYVVVALSLYLNFVCGSGKSDSTQGRSPARGMGRARLLGDSPAVAGLPGWAPSYQRKGKTRWRRPGSPIIVNESLTGAARRPGLSESCQSGVSQLN